MGSDLHCFPCPIYILVVGPGKTCDLAMLNRRGDLSYCVKVTFRRYGKTCFDNVNAESFKLSCDTELLLRVHGIAGRLFSVS